MTLCKWSTQPGHPSWVGTTSASESWGAKRHTTRCVVSQHRLMFGRELQKRRPAPPYMVRKELHVYVYTMIYLLTYLLT